MSDFSFRPLVQSRDPHLFNQLKTLADSADGPLRVKMKGIVPYIGIRDWPTYFFEKITCAFNLNSLKNIEKETIEAIQLHASPILEANSGPDQPSPHMLLHKLCARTSESSLQPRLGRPAFLNASTTEPKYKDFSVVNATVRVVDGMMIVPKGLTITIKEIGYVMADCHLAANTKPVSGIDRSPANNADTPAFNYAIPKITLPVLYFVGPAPSEQEFYDYYYQTLSSNTDSIHTCVALEVFSNTALGPSSANRNGAVRAADRFMEERKDAGKSVSISLSVKNNLPAITLEPNITLSDWHSDAQDAQEKFITLDMPESETPETFRDYGPLTSLAVQLDAGANDTNDKLRKVHSGSSDQRTEESSDSDTEYSSDEDYLDDPKTSGKTYRTGGVNWKEKFGNCVESDVEDDDDNAPLVG
jgi:hypothetical protein